MKYNFSEIVDIANLQRLMERLYLVSGISSGIIDTEGNLLVAVGWRDICTKFHRVNCGTKALCRQSDLFIEKYLRQGKDSVKPYIWYECLNGLIDAAAPIIIEGEHVATIYQGQFLFEKPDIEKFLYQARKYDFDEIEYLKALDRVPIYSKEKLDGIMQYFIQLAVIFGEMGVDRLKLIESQKEALQESEESLKNIQQADQNKDAFINMLSHELRNPLASMMMSLTLLKNTPIEEEQAINAIKIALRQGEQLTRIVDDLLDVTRITQNKITLQKERVELNKIVQMAVTDYNVQFSERGVTLETHLTSEIDLEADPARLIQVIGNLLHNSVKFSSKGDKTRVAVSRDEVTKEAVITIKDTGIGIKPEVLPNLFEPFMQVESTLDRSKGGLGLGLTIVKGIVELHGGTVSVYSQGLGQGTQFTIRLPEAAVHHQEKEMKTCRLPVSSLRILIIDDIPDIYEILCLLLQHLGHKVMTASSGREGLLKAKEFNPDVLICDIGLPDMDGYEVAAHFRYDHDLHDVFLIALSGYAQAEDLERSKAAGFDQHLAKPVNLDALEKTLANVRHSGHEITPTSENLAALTRSFVQ
ncbi:PocR ligand-binding domain-containing protein [Dehalobacter sp. DCM]|uniref:ATP-binding response regulator n=1 Tax=Dehalobacter sp. DCM TaxID=2907827 RepID=UPI003081DAB2|nr:PocR ligand-binding domain-containing protein [Dehalobacter sp. DCM]